MVVLKKIKFDFVTASIVLGFIGFCVWLSAAGIHSNEREKMMLSALHSTDEPSQESEDVASSMDKESLGANISAPTGKWVGLITTTESTVDGKIAIDLEINDDKSFLIRQTMYSEGRTTFTSSAAGFYEIKGKLIIFTTAEGKPGFFSTKNRLFVQSASQSLLLIRGMIAGHEEQSMSMRIIKAEPRRAEDPNTER